METQSERKIIQIAVTKGIAYNGICIPLLYALCDDGTVWNYNYDVENNARWLLVQSIPQSKVDA